MTPDNQDDRRVGTPLVPQRSFLSGEPSARRDASTREAAANIAREQLSSIYGGNSRTPTPHTTPTPVETQPTNTDDQPINAYDRTHTPTVTALQEDQWQRYHSAWQDYYKKYYERYYAAQIEKSKAEQNSTPHEAKDTEPTPVNSLERSTLSQNEAMLELRRSLLGKIRRSADKVRSSRHFVPAAAGLGIIVLFLFLQYNRILMSNVQAYISPGNVNPANFIVNPSTELTVGPDPKLIIPKINVDVPVVYDVTPDYDAQMQAMENGVAYFGIPGANSKPGQVGNTVLSGHSSNDILDKGDYKFIFARLDQLETGDSIYVNYEGKRYTYTVTKKKVVTPTQVDALVYQTTKPELTLITCTPLGTSLNRLLVTAEQVSPSPSTASAAPAANTSPSSASMPGNSPTLLQRMFGGGN
jgi:sortase A